VYVVEDLLLAAALPLVDFVVAIGRVCHGKKANEHGFARKTG
jgi:hypothetical protein